MGISERYAFKHTYFLVFFFFFFFFFGLPAFVKRLHSSVTVSDALPLNSDCFHTRASDKKG